MLVEINKSHKPQMRLIKQPKSPLKSQFQCDKCGKFKKTRDEFEIHQLSCLSQGEKKNFKKIKRILRKGIGNKNFMTPIHNRRTNLVQENGSDKDGYICSFCTYSYKSLAYIKKHQRICHFLENRQNSKLLALASDKKTFELDKKSNPIKIITYQILYLKLQDEQQCLYKYYKCYFCSYTDFRLALIKKHQIKNCFHVNKPESVQIKSLKNNENSFDQEQMNSQEEQQVQIQDDQSRSSEQFISIEEVGNLIQRQKQDEKEKQMKENEPEVLPKKSNYLKMCQLI